MKNKNCNERRMKISSPFEPSLLETEMEGGLLRAIAVVCYPE